MDRKLDEVRQDLGQRIDKLEVRTGKVEEVAHHNGILIENLQSQIESVAEGVVTTKREARSLP